MPVEVGPVVNGRGQALQTGCFGRSKIADDPCALRDEVAGFLGEGS